MKVGTRREHTKPVKRDTLRETAIYILYMRILLRGHNKIEYKMS